MEKKICGNCRYRHKPTSTIDSISSYWGQNFPKYRPNLEFWWDTIRIRGRACVTKIKRQPLHRSRPSITKQIHPHTATKSNQRSKLWLLHLYICIYLLLLTYSGAVACVAGYIDITFVYIIELLGLKLLFHFDFLVWWVCYDEGRRGVNSKQISWIFYSCLR